MVSVIVFFSGMRCEITNDIFAQYEPARKHRLDNTINFIKLGLYAIEWEIKNETRRLS